jgi:hypothetical protein
LLQAGTDRLGHSADINGPVPILDIRRQRRHPNHEPLGIHQDMAFAALYLLAGIVPAIPPFSVVFTD